MSMFRNLLMVSGNKSRLPSEYQEVEYVQSHGNQYINTKIYMNGRTDFEIDFEATSTVQWGAIIGTDWINMPARLYYGIFNNYSITTNYLYVGNNTVTFNNPYGQLNTKTKAQYTSSNKTLTVTNANGVLTKPISYSNIGTSTYPIYFYAINRNGNASDVTISKVYKVIIEKDGEEVGNFIPCYRKADDTIGFYDLITEEFFTNAGSGTFTKGPDVE